MFCPHLSSKKDQEKESCSPIEEKRPYLFFFFFFSQILNSGSIQKQLSFEPCNAKTIAMEWSFNSLSLFLMANINCWLQQDHLQCVSH